MSIHNFNPTRFQTRRQSQSFQCLFPTSDYLTQSITSSTWSTDPQAVLLQRWRDMADELATMRLSRSSVVALNRHLDEAESLLARDASATRRYKEETVGLGISKDIPSGSPMSLNADSPPRSEKIDAPEAANFICSTEQVSQSAKDLLERVTRAASQLRQRQKDYKVSF